MIENFRPGVMDRLGLGADGDDGGEPAPHLLLAARLRLGRSARPGQRRGKAWSARRPARIAPVTRATASRSTRSFPTARRTRPSCARSRVAMALNARERSGLGQRVEIPLFDATFSVVGARGLLVNGKPVAEPEFNWSRQLPCKDGRWLMYVANNKRFEAFIKSIGMDKWRDAKLPPKELAQKFDEVMRTRTAKEWEDIIAEIGSEGVICHTSAEWLRASAGAGVEDHRRLRRSGARPLPRPRHQRAPFATRRARCARRARRPMRIARRSCSELASAQAPRSPCEGEGGGRGEALRSALARRQGRGPLHRPRRPDLRAHAGRVRRRRHQDRQPAREDRAAAQRHQPRQAQHPHRSQDRRRAGDLLEARRSGRRGAPELPRRRRRAARHRLRAACARAGRTSSTAP